MLVSLRLLSTVLLLAVAIEALPVPVSNTFQHHVDIPRVSVQDFADYYSQATRARETPIIVKHLMSEQQCEFICDTIMSQQTLQVQLQRRRPNIPTNIYSLGIQQAIDFIMYKSSHSDAFWCFQEGLLEQCDALNDIRMQLQHHKESLFSNDNWFSYFPIDLIPSDCVILAGEGSTSTLHRDPFEWTGTSLCLEGSKIWRFIEPPNDQVKVVDDFLESYRLPSMAWEQDDRNTPLSAGWQSDYRLYAHRDASIPSARDLYEREDKLEYLDTLASSPLLLQGDLFDQPHTVWSTVQQTGDFLVIPAHWWHQTYGVEPSVAVASQRCSWKESRRVMQHMVDTTGVDLNVDEILDINDPKQSVDNFFAKLNVAMRA